METKDEDTIKDDKKKRILSHNIDVLESENRPEELQAVFKGSDQEKLKAMKKGKDELIKNKHNLGRFSQTSKYYPVAGLFTKK